MTSSRRHYDPVTERFLTRDPAAALTREPYGYAGGNPLNFTDSTGHNKCEVGANPVRWIGNAHDCVADHTSAPELVDDAWDKLYGASETVVRCFGDFITCADNIKIFISPIVVFGLTIAVGYGLVLACATVIGCFVAAPLLGTATVGGLYATWLMVDRLWIGEGHDCFYSPLGGHH